MAIGKTEKTRRMHGYLKPLMQASITAIKQPSVIVYLAEVII